MSNDEKVEFSEEHLKNTCHRLAEYQLIELTPNELQDKINTMLKRVQIALKAQGHDLPLEEVENIVKTIILEDLSDGEEE